MIHLIQVIQFTFKKKRASPYNYSAAPGKPTKPVYMSADPQSQCTGFDFTLDASACELSTFQAFLHEWCKKWVFQLEKGNQNGYDHYQCRVQLYVKQRHNEIVAKTKHMWPGKSRRWSYTTKGVHDGQNFNYVMKADTRIDGPWSNQDYEVPPVLTRQLRTFAECELYPWQQQVKQMCIEEDDRTIKLIWDPRGAAGKSIMAEYLEYNRVAYEVPAMRLMEDIMQCVMSIRTYKCYLIDMPRAMKKDKLCDFYSGLEALKNGVAYDKRYSFKKKRFDRPQVIVFSNRLPQWDFLSLDRWQVWQMNPDRSLTQFPVPGLPDEADALCSPP